MISDQLHDNIFLPPASSSKLQLMDLESTYLKVQQTICKTFVESGYHEISSFENLKKFLGFKLTEKADFASQSLHLLFSNEKMLVPGLVGIEARKQFSFDLADKYIEFWNQVEYDEEMQLKLVSQMWIAASPVSILSGMVANFYQILPSIAEIILKKLITIVELRYDIEIGRDLSPSTLMKINPLVRGIELEERNHILLGFVSRIRERENLSEELWLKTSDLINELSNDVVVSSLEVYFKEGVKNSEFYHDFYVQFSEIVGNKLAEDKLYQGFIDNMSNEIRKLLVGVSHQITKAKSEDQVIQIIARLHENVSMKFSMMLFAGALIYDEKSIKKKIIENIAKLKELASPLFEQKLLLTLLPISHFSEENALSICEKNSPNFKLHSGYYSTMKAVIKEIMGLVSFRYGHYFFRKLVMSFDSPLRNYVGLGFLDEKFFEDNAKSLKLSKARPLDKGCLINYWLLCQEEKYHRNVLAPFIETNVG